MSLSQSTLPFFGLTYKQVPQYRKALFEEIHEIVYFGNGGYTWETVYNMPTWLRKFTWNQIQKYINSKSTSSDNTDNVDQTIKMLKSQQPDYKSTVKK